MSLVQAHQKDNVATSVKAVHTGENLRGNITAKEDIPSGHKIAIQDIPLGQPIIKYGETIGLATKDIFLGQHVHIHNVESRRGRGDKQ